MNTQELIREVYRAFNARDIELVLSRMDPNVDWPNGMTGGREHGRDAVRAYWTYQWGVVNPRVEPLRITINADGSTTVLVHQVVHDNEGKLLVDQQIEHIYELSGDHITRMNIHEIPQP